jgi:hypothetical protein
LAACSLIAVAQVVDVSLRFLLLARMVIAYKDFCKHLNTYQIANQKDSVSQI